jgi:cell division protein FtsB
MEENKEKIEQFETDETEEKKKKEERKKSKKRFWKRIKNLALVIIFFGAIYLIVIRSRQIQSLKKKIDDEKKRKEEDKNILADSTIINGNIEDKEMIKKWINPELSFQTKLLYRLSRDGPSIFNFHSKCDYITPTLVLVESDEQNKFGGYTTATWDMFGNVYKNSSKTFMFSLEKNKKYFRKSNIKYSGDIFSGSRDIGPWFGIHDLYFYGTMKDCYTYKYSGQCLFLDGNGLTETTNIDNSVPIKEVEVYQIIFKY